jgi:hypothetical protein
MDMPMERAGHDSEVDPALVDAYMQGYEAGQKDQDGYIARARELLAIVQAWCYTPGPHHEFHTHPLYPANNFLGDSAASEKPLADAIREFLERTA